MTNNATHQPTCHVVPILRGQNRASITPPWFPDGCEYTAKMASFKPLVNGREAFGEVYRAIEDAKRSVCIICWGFQPSMYFVRQGSPLMIGQLLEKKAREGVMVRVLCWAFQVGPYDRLNVTGVPLGLGEPNTPGRWMVRLYDQFDGSSNEQYQYDKKWYRIYDRKQSAAGEFNRRHVISDDFPKDKLLFTSRTYMSADKALIGSMRFMDEGLTKETKSTLKGYPSHHQKTVLVDYEDSQAAVGFVMGHNMLDGYWDSCEHSSKTHPPYSGRNALKPLHDYSSRVTGPITGDLFNNFATAWQLETGEQLPTAPFSEYPVHRGDPRAFCQILRTQPQYGRKDVMNCYLQAVSNATQYIHIENQYFRWPPLAERIKASAAKQVQCGRTPERHGFLHLFVITNSTDAGMGVGTVNTYRMLDSLGRADRIPEVAREQRLEAIEKELESIEREKTPLVNQRTALDNQARLLQGTAGGGGGLTERYESINRRLNPLEERQRQLEEAKARLEPRSLREQIMFSDRTPEAIRKVRIPGLKIHVATLVAPDTAAGEPWQEVYIHAKLMLIDDSFMTLGSTNINTRSMETDSELNIAHHRPEITAPLRHRQWEKYTAGKVAAGMSLTNAFVRWQDIMDENADAKKAERRPIAQLAEFLRTSDKISNKD